MNFTIEKAEHFAVLTPKESRINTLNAPKLKSELVLLHNNGHRNLILDMNQVTYIDSSGLSSLLMAKRLCDTVKGTFTLCEVTPHVKKMVQIAQLDKVLNLLPTLAEAKEDANMHELQQELSGGVSGANPDSEQRLESDPGNA